jgi:hypothetical protein
MKLDWRKFLLYITIAGSEFCWLYALMSFLNSQAAEGQLSLLWILPFYLVSVGANYLLGKLRWHRFIVHGLSWVAFAAVLLLLVKNLFFAGLPWSDNSWLLAMPRAIPAVIYAFQPELLVFISAGVIWWLGRRLACLKLDFAIMVSEFQFGLLIFIITFLIASGLHVEIGRAIYLILAFFLFSLLGISMAHAMEGTGWLSGLNRGSWSGLLLISLALILVLGFVISALVTPDLLQVILNAVKWVLGWVWYFVLKAILFIANLLPAPKPEDLPPPDASPLGGASSDNFTFSIPEVLRRSLRAGYAVIVIGIFVFALWRVSSEVFKWLRRRMTNTSGAEIESVKGGLKADLLNLLKLILSGLRTLGRLWPHKPRNRPAVQEVASVRHIYRQFLRWARSGGIPRQTSQTPGEFLDKIADRLPEMRGELELITGQYVRARYGTWLPGENEIQQLRQSWHNVKESHLITGGKSNG